ncbi:MAG: hypothetical protein JJU05_10480 [Verrucomicrobia bacterium]|nr:hypothetical protein [Verrucomicrobiota bacterium]MCH8527135.1 hypothetical protein [Kiritimatiellia bacterium]
MKEYEKTGTTGVTGRAASRGLERFSFLPPVLLLVAVMGGIFGWQYLKNWRPRAEVDFAAQYDVVERTVRTRAERQGLTVDIPPREAWRVRSFGDVDEWHGRVRVETGSGGREVPTVISFNLKIRGLVPRWESDGF